MSQQKTFSRQEATAWATPNYWDAIALCLVFGVIVLLAWGAKQMTTPYHVGQPIVISLSPSHLPYYALRSLLRLLIALVCSLIFTFIFGTWAAKSRYAERVIIPLIDILQSVPVLGYLAITVVAFIALFPNSIMGPECAAILAIFTSQVWNITLSFYQSLRTVPLELQEAADMFQLSGWQRFWRVEVPFSMPGLLWNCMLSMSASWFFVVASEAITVSNQTITLPGIGSYIALAISHADMKAIGYAILAMFIVILFYDQLLFRPLNQWIGRFKFEEAADESEPSAWLVNLFQRTRFLRNLDILFAWSWRFFVNFSWFLRRHKIRKKIKSSQREQHIFLYWNIFLLLLVLAGTWLLLHFIFQYISLKAAWHIVILGAVTGLRVFILIIISSLVWVPIGVWIGLRPKVARFAQPMIQFAAAFPANLLFPLVVIGIITFHLNVNIWVSPLMILGTQWYILFNVIAGASALPKDLKQAASNLQVHGWLWWRKLIFPGIFPYFVTGAITAAGGAWNASIIAEVVSWGHTKLVAMGLGSYITHYSTVGNFPQLALGIGVMCLYVLLINHLLWGPLYNYAEERFKF